MNIVRLYNIYIYSTNIVKTSLSHRTLAPNIRGIWTQSDHSSQPHTQILKYTLQVPQVINILLEMYSLINGDMELISWLN